MAQVFEVIEQVFVDKISVPYIQLTRVISIFNCATEG